QHDARAEVADGRDEVGDADFHVAQQGLGHDAGGVFPQAQGRVRVGQVFQGVLPGQRVVVAVVRVGTDLPFDAAGRRLRLAQGDGHLEPRVRVQDVILVAAVADRYGRADFGGEEVFRALERL